jgi:hypothetical protein
MATTELEIVKRPHRSTREARERATRARMRELAKRAPHLTDVRYQPLLRNFSMLSQVMERAFERLMKEEDFFSPRTGEFRNSIDILRRLSDSHATLCRELRLSPRVRPPGLMDLAEQIAAGGKDETDGE